MDLAFATSADDAELEESVLHQRCHLTLLRHHHSLKLFIFLESVAFVAISLSKAFSAASACTEVGALMASDINLSNFLSCGVLKYF